MHPCLSVDEIVRLIAYELVASQGRATAVALACCCKSFEDPVLDTLWETQGHFLPLIKSLPGDVWNPGGYNVGVSTTSVSNLFLFNSLSRKSFRRLPTKLEWARFRKYARRMRKFQPHVILDSLTSQVLPVLQSRAFSEPLLPNLKTLKLWSATGDLIPFIPLFLSPGTTVINIEFTTSGLPEVVTASMITTLPTLCPNLQKIMLYPLPRGPVITAAVSELLLTIDRDSIRSFHVDSLLTEEAREMVYKLPNLCELMVVIDGPTLLPTLVLPNLTEIDVEYDRDCGWLQGFRGATFGKLASVTIRSESSSIGDFLEAFKSVALTTSTPETLSTFGFYTSSPWRPNYRSLLPFTQLKELIVEFSCVGGCSSTIDDDVITDLARTMPKLETLHFGEEPCKTPTGVTAKGLAALAYYCPRLTALRIHFQVASFDPVITSGGGSTIPWEDCALTDLDVGDISLPEVSALMVALTLLRIFPRLDCIQYRNMGWEQVANAITHSKWLADRSSKKHLFATLRSNIDDASPRRRTRGRYPIVKCA